MGRTGNKLSCDMKRGCTDSVTMLDEKGFIYCTIHGVARRGGGFRVRKLRPGEIKRLESGKPLPTYSPGKRSIDDGDAGSSNVRQAVFYTLEGTLLMAPNMQNAYTEAVPIRDGKVPGVIIFGRRAYVVGAIVNDEQTYHEAWTFHVPQESYMLRDDNGMVPKQCGNCGRNLDDDGTCRAGCGRRDADGNNMDLEVE